MLPGSQTHPATRWFAPSGANRDNAALHHHTHPQGASR